uniref:Reverse transcriptase zinc-binding domain-containing protein n=1 Tax=Setaria viridis TaxID=4556 RepID=A0A4U6TEB1_SETVI|nr:LOW QUALITY PROTEIN: hypothetical protein SEVIR_8G113900v2 [Setaria viridis]
MFLLSYDCVLCHHGVEETLFHLLLGCSFAQECWIHLGIFANLLDEPYDILESFKQQLQVPFFMEIIIIMSWSIWNDWIFKGISQFVQSYLSTFKLVFTQVILRVKEDWKSTMSWLDQIV